MLVTVARVMETPNVRNLVASHLMYSGELTDHVV